MTTMIERGAIAAASAYGHDWATLPEKEKPNTGEHDREMWREISRSVIAAMREPTAAMIDAMYDEYQGGGKGSLRDAYRGAIDAELAADSPPT